MTPDERLIGWLRKVAVYSNDGWLAREARAEYVALTGSEPLADWEREYAREQYEQARRDRADAIAAPEESA